jgi:hypothetical protein
MITVVVQGGVGNQLFQYAYGRTLMERGKEVLFNISCFDGETKYTKRFYALDAFLLSSHISVTHSARPRQHFLKRLWNALDVDRRVRYVSPDLQVTTYVADGYYNSERYFSFFRETLLKEIVLRERSDHYVEWEQRILNAKNPLIIHVRRTDYVGSGFVNLDESYYMEALNLFKKEEADVFVFSDDVAFVREMFDFPFTLVSGNGLADYEELMLMSLGKNFIIANSTFSWWGAWLSQREGKKVVAPKRWFKSPLWWRANRDIIPQSWIRI